MEGTFEEFLAAANKAKEAGADLGLASGETVEQKTKKFQQLLFDPSYDYSLTEKSPGTQTSHLLDSLCSHPTHLSSLLSTLVFILCLYSDSDWIKQSGVNFYDESISLEEVKKWSEAGNEKNDLNSTLIKKDGKFEEFVWRAGVPGSIPPGIYPFFPPSLFLTCLKQSNTIPYLYIHTSFFFLTRGR